MKNSLLRLLLVGFTGCPRQNSCIALKIHELLFVLELKEFSTFPQISYCVKCMLIKSRNFDCILLQMKITRILVGGLHQYNYCSE